MAHRLFRPLAALLFACFAPAWARAAELGEPRVSSYIGQQLVADVELTSLLDAAHPLQARLASADVYRGASIAMPAVLSSLNMAVMRRDGRQFLHLTSLSPVQADHLHVFLELRDGDQQSVRLATLWLAPNPAPAPVAAAVQQVAAPVAAPVPVPTKAVPPALPASAPVAAPKPSVLPAAPKPLAAHAHVADAAPMAKPAPTTKPAPITKPAPVTEPAPVTKPAPLTKPAPGSAAPIPHAALKSAISHPATPALSAQAAACITLDGKNEALRTQIGQLEQKVRVLQGALKGGPAVPPPKLAPASKSRLALRKAKAKHPPEESTPLWIWIAAGAGAVLALAGGAVLVIRRRNLARKAKKAKKPLSPLVVTPSVMGGVRSRLMTDPAPETPVEPTLG
jgi:hypothetical protein